MAKSISFHKQNKKQECVRQMMKVTPSNFMGSNYVYLGLKLSPDSSPIFFYRQCFLKKEDRISFERDRNLCAELNGDNLPDRPPRSPAHHPEGGNHQVRLTGYRSVMFTHLRSARLRSLHSDSLHITSLAFPDRFPVEMQYAPGLSRCSGTSGCSRPLLIYRFAECSSLLIVLMLHVQ